MRFIVMVLAICILGGCAGGEQKEKKEKITPTASRLSADFSRSVDSIMSEYQRLTESFVDWDTVTVIREAGILSPLLNHLPQGEIAVQQQRTAALDIVQARNDLNVMQLHNNITDKRHALNSLTEHLFHFLQTVGYDGRKLYLQECPMAFNDDVPGVWLSERDTIRNPYMGIHHPLYGKAMVECGQNKSIIGQGALPRPDANADSEKPNPKKDDNHPEPRKG